MSVSIPLPKDSGPSDWIPAVGELFMVYWPILAVSFGVSLVMTPICRAFALKKGIVDKPDEWLKPHGRPIAYLGGVAIFLGWVAGVAFAMWRYAMPPGTTAADVAGPFLDGRLLTGVLLGAVGIVLLGLFDDLRVMTPRIKLAGNIGVAVLLIVFGLGDEAITVLTDRVGVTFDAGERWLVLLYSIPITMFIIVGACNATNLIDGLDGLCSGVLGIVSIGFAILAFHLHVYRSWNASDTMLIVLSLSMLGGAMGFLPYNRNPATIFMGDTGSMLLGLNSAVILLIFVDDLNFRWMVAAVMIFGLPVADMVLTLVRRWRAQRPLMQGDRSHFYDQLRDRGYSVRGVVRISYGLTLMFVVNGLLSTVMRMRHFLIIYVVFFMLLAYAVHRMRMVRVDGPTAGEHA